MARALAYVLQFESEVYQHNHLIEIWEEGFIGTPTNLRMGMSGLISKRERDGGIYGTSMELKLESTLDSQLIKLYTADSKKFLVKHYRNNVLVQSGLIVPEQYSEEYIAAPYDILVTATDGLGLLKEQNYNYFGRHTVLEVLKYCLDSTGVILDFDLVCELTESGADPARSILAQRTIDGEHWRGRTIYDVLTELSATFRAFITQHNGRWRFARYSDLQSQSMIYTNALTYLISLPNNSLVLGNLNNDIYPIGALNFAIDPAFKSVKFTRTYAKRVSFFSNPEFKQLDQWDVGSMASTRVFRDKNYVILRSLYAGEQISQTISVEQSERVFNFNISYFRISYTPTVFYVKFKLVGTNGQTYWLGKEGWQSTESSFSMEANEISDVESIYPTSTDLRSRQTLQQTGSVQWVGIPSAGALTLIILAKGPQSVGTDESRRSQFAITDALLTTEVEKGLTVDALLSTGNLSAPDTEIFFGDADVGDNPANILTNFFLRPDGSKSSLWKVGAAGAEDSFFNTIVKDYVVWYGLPKRLLTGEVMGNNLQTAMCLLDKFGDTFMYIDTMTLDVFADQAEIEAREIIPHMNVMAINEEVEDPTSPNITIWYETLPDGSRVKRFTVNSTGSSYRRSTSPGANDLTLEEILKAQSIANFSAALAALAQRKADEANLAALAAAESADDALLRLNNIASNSIVSIEEKAALVQLIDRLSDEIILYKADSTNKGASVEELENSFDALVDFLTITVEIMNSAAATELTAEEITQYSALFADFYAKKSVFTTDVSSIRAELISFKNRIDSIDQDKAKVLAEYEALINTTGPTEAAKTALTIKKDEYITAHTAYKAALSSAITDDKITDVERTAANALFETYSTKLDSYNTAAETMRKSVTDAINTTLSAWIADGVISPLEKLAIRQTRAQVLSEKESLIADAGVYDIATTAYVTAWTAYDTALAKYSAEEPEIITVDTDFASSESAYSVAKKNLQSSFASKNKGLIDLFTFDPATQSIKANYNFYSVAGVSSFGIGTGGSSGGGANVINDLVHSVYNSSEALSAYQGYVLKGLVDSKEPAFIKNTAFNKSFGASAGTVAEGNDSRIINGQTAFDWGNHALAGYASASSLSNYLGVSANPNTPINGNFAIGSYNGRNFIQSHSGQPIDLNPLGNAVTINGNNPYHSGNFNPANYALLAGSSSQAFSVSSLTASNVVVAGGNKGFQNDIYYTNVANPIWTFGNAPTYGISYYQGTALSAVGDAIGFHFGNVASPVFYVSLNGDIRCRDITINGALSGATTGSFSGNVSAASFISGGNAVLHSGNYSSYALALSGGIINGGFGALMINRNEGAYYSGVGFRNTSEILGYLGFSPSKEPVFVESDLSNIRQIYHTGNLTNTLSNGYLPYWNGSSLVNSILYQNGAIGVGTNNPLTQIHIHNPSTSWGQYSTVRISSDIQTSNYVDLKYYRGMADTEQAFILNVAGTEVIRAFVNGNTQLNGAISFTGNLFNSSRISVLAPWGSAQGMNIGSLLVSGSYSDIVYVPNNGIYAAGSIHSSTSIKIGANWEAIPNGNDLELRYGGVMKAKLSSSGDILAVGGVTAFAV